MTNKERVKATLNWRRPDRVPYFEQGVASKVAAEVLGRTARTGGGGFRREGIEAAIKGPDAHREYIETHLKDWGDLVEALDFDVVTPTWSGGGVPTEKLDDFTYFFGSHDADWGVERYDPASDTLYTVDSSLRRDGLAAVRRHVEAAKRSAEEPPAPDHFWALQRLIDRFGERRAVAGGSGIAIPMQAPWLEALKDEPGLIHDYLDACTEIACRDIETQAHMGVDLIWGGGDLAYNSGPIYSPKDFREFILPRLKRMVKKCHEHSLAYFFRTDGVIWPIADQLFEESGADGYGEIDAQAGMDLAQIRARFPRLLLWGNVDCAGALVKGAPEDAAAETRACIDKLASTGGHMLGSSNVIHAGVPARNFMAMIETCREYGRY